MSCGICNPDAFRLAYGCEAPRGRVFGYASPVRGSSVFGDVAHLYFMGARIVFWDDSVPSGVNLFCRPNLKRLSKVMRSGDALLVNHPSALGDRPARIDRAVSAFAAMGVTVYFPREDCHSSADQGKAA